MLETITFVIFAISLVEFSQALISCNKNNVTKIQLCLMNNDSLDIQTYPDVVEYGRSNKNNINADFNR